MIASMSEYVRAASQQNRVVPGFNVFGYEDALAVIRAAEIFDAPVILMSNSDSVEHQEPKHSAALYRSLAESADVPVVIHLDHAKTVGLIEQAIDAGYTSVMYDGSALPIEQNIENSLKVLELAGRSGVSVEAELGSVPYTDRNEDVVSVLTSPEDVRTFIAAAPVDALAVAVGQLHRMKEKTARLDFSLIKAVEDVCDVPLVIHGTSGIVDQDVRKMLSTRVGKANIGTALRLAFGNELKSEVRDRPDEYDRLRLFKKPMRAVQAAAEEKYRLLGWEERSS